MDSLKKYSFAAFIFCLMAFHAKSQNFILEPSDFTNLTGKRIKFLGDKEKIMSRDTYYRIKPQKKSSAPNIPQEDLIGRIAKIIDFKSGKGMNQSVYTLELEDSNEKIYLVDFQPNDFYRNQFGFLDELELAREKIIGNTYFNSDAEECVVENVFFANDPDHKMSTTYSLSAKDPNFIVACKCDGEDYNAEVFLNKPYMTDSEKEFFEMTEKSGLNKYKRYDYFDEYFFTTSPYNEITLVNVENYFEVKKDPFENTVSYVNKKYFDPSEKYGYDLIHNFDKIMIFFSIIQLDNIPYLSLRSKHEGSSWIFHDQLDVKIGEKVFRYKSDKNTQSVGEFVNESVSYSREEAYELAEAISNNLEDEVLVRISGDWSYQVILKKKEKLIIKETYDLYNILSQKLNSSTGF